jgi:predicted transposase/invertase (TIGR01784 family)
MGGKVSRPPDFAENLLSGYAHSINQGVGAYLDAVIRGNTETFQEVIKMRKKSKKSMGLEEILMEEGILPQWIEKGRREGREEGWKKGREENRIETAKNALAEGATVEFVSRITGLDPATVKSFAVR